MHILAATDFSTRSQGAVRRAGLLARSSGSQLTLAHVVDDDQPPDLVALETREAERILGEQIGAVAELRGLPVRALVVEGDPFDGILRAAASTAADLIVMGAHRKQLLRDIVVGTTIERVIRTAISEADEALSPLRTEPSGTLRVSAPMTVTLTRLSASIPRFLSRYPQITLDLHLDDRRIDLVREGFDLAIRGSDSLEDSSLIAKKLAVMPHVLCAAPSYFEARGRPQVPADLRSHECIRFSLSGHADA